MKLAYFVHDLSDPAVARRLRMLKVGGAEPVVLGFRRTEAAPETLEGCPTVDLGRTYDARLGHRAKMTALTALKARRFREVIAGTEVILARQLEMLAIAQAAHAASGLKARLVYEALDIHRMMLQDTVAGLAMRTVEKALLRRSDLLIVSSPAFVESYFKPIQGLGEDLRTPVMLVENKVLELDGAGPAAAPPPPPGPPWRIGWMGAIRCRRSLDVLTGLAGISGGRGMLAKGRSLSAMKEDTSMEGVAGCALWLLSDLGKSTTGECIHVDAGFHIMGFSDEEEQAG